MAWLYLGRCGAVREIGWPLGLKMAGDRRRTAWWIIFAIVAMTVSGALLMSAQRVIPMGTAYAVWTGIGAVGAFVMGILPFGDSGIGHAHRLDRPDRRRHRRPEARVKKEEGQMRMKDKVALISGAASGMGAAPPGCSPAKAPGRGRRRPPGQGRRGGRRRHQEGGRQGAATSISTSPTRPSGKSAVDKTDGPAASTCW